MSRALAFALLALLALAACGVKAPPRPPIESKPNPAGPPATTQQGNER